MHVQCVICEMIDIYTRPEINVIKRKGSFFLMNCDNIRNVADVSHFRPIDVRRSTNDLGTQGRQVRMIEIESRLFSHRSIGDRTAATPVGLYWAVAGGISLGLWLLIARAAAHFLCTERLKELPGPSSQGHRGAFIWSLAANRL